MKLRATYNNTSPEVIRKPQSVMSLCADGKYCYCCFKRHAIHIIYIKKETQIDISKLSFNLLAFS